MFTQFVNYIQKNVGTTAVTLVTCPTGNQLVVNQLSCANTTNFPVTCSVTVTRAGTVVFIVNNATVPAGGSLICAGDDQKIVLMAGDVIQVRSSTASSIDAVVSGVLNDFNRTATVPAPPVSPVATFSITPSTTSTFEGSTVTYNITTTNVPNGTVLYWENFGTTTAQDFTDDRNDGEFVITGNAGSFTRTLKTTGLGGDPGGEPAKTIQIAVQFRPGYLGGGAVAGASTVTVEADIISSGLVLNLDAGNTFSYPGSGTTFTDLSGFGNNFTLINGPTYSSANGGGIVFDGVNDYSVRSSISASSELSVTDNFTIEQIFRPTAYQPSNYFGLTNMLLNKGTASTYNYATQVSSDTSFSFIKRTDPEGLQYSTFTVPSMLNKVNVVTLVIQNGSNSSIDTVSCYYNGSFVATVNIAGLAIAPQNNTPFYLGGLSNVANTMFIGTYHSGRVYNRALAATEVQQNFNTLRGRYGI